MSDRQLFRIGGGQTSDKFLRKLQHLAGLRTYEDWDEDMQPTAAGRLRKRNKVEIIQHGLRKQTGLCGICELSRLRIQVEANPIRFWKSLGPASTHVYGDTSQIG